MPRGWPSTVTGHPPKAAVTAAGDPAASCAWTV
jgi:hypothetical protein